jgi:hypothetical protein
MMDVGIFRMIWEKEAVACYRYYPGIRLEWLNNISKMRN